jgi:hypothetical protein
MTGTWRQVHDRIRETQVPAAVQHCDDSNYGEC